MPIIYDLKTDVRYVQGFERGLELAKKRLEEEKNKRNTLLVEAFLLNTFLTTKRIADLVETTEKFVNQIKEKLIAKGKLLK